MNRTSPLPTSAAALAAVAGAVLAAGCGSQDASGSAGDEGRGGAGGDPNARLYRVEATVLENEEHGPQLCRTMALSMPPKCGGPDVVGWNWDDVKSRSANGTTYTDTLTLVGTWDGERFTPTEKPEPAGGSDGPGGIGDPVDRGTPCKELKDEAKGEAEDGAEGAKAADGAAAAADGAGDAGRQRVLQKARKMPGYAGAWVDGDVVNLRFAETTGDGDGGAGGPDAAERELRATWDGPLCVVGAEHTEDELKRVQRQVDEHVDDMLGSAVDPVSNAVTLDVLVATPELQRELDKRYGEDTVRLSGWLEPVA